MAKREDAKTKGREIYDAVMYAQETESVTLRSSCNVQGTLRLKSSAIVVGNIVDVSWHQAPDVIGLDTRKARKDRKGYIRTHSGFWNGKWPEVEVEATWCQCRHWVYYGHNGAGCRASG
jgi:predicted secreted hydrolase